MHGLTTKLLDVSNLILRGQRWSHVKTHQSRSPSMLKSNSVSLSDKEVIGRVYQRDRAPELQVLLETGEDSVFR